MIYLFLAEGFEETEAIAPLDVLRRCSVDVKTVGIGGTSITSSHHVSVVPDLTEEEVLLDETFEGLILPGGMPGTLNLEASPVVQAALDYAADHQKLIGAICAAPSILGHKQLLAGKKATCFPGFEKDLLGAEVTGESVVLDGHIITANGAGSALPFGRALAAYLVGSEKAASVLESMQYPY